MICDYCESGFEPRKSGKPQKFCPGGDCRRIFYAEARRRGARLLRRPRRPKSIKSPIERALQVADGLARYADRLRKDLAAIAVSGGSPMVLSRNRDVGKSTT